MPSLRQRPGLSFWSTRRCIFANHALGNISVGAMGIVALYPSAQYVPLKTRVLLDRLAAHIAAVMNARPEAHPECIDDAMCEAVAANRT